MEAYRELPCSRVAAPGVLDPWMDPWMACQVPRGIQGPGLLDAARLRGAEVPWAAVVGAGDGAFVGRTSCATRPCAKAFRKR